MRVIIEDFLNYLETNRNAASNTVSSYERDIVKFSNYFKEKGKKIFNLHKSDMVEYIEFIKSEGKSNATISRLTASIKAFYKYLINKNLVEENIVNGIEISKVDKKKPSILSKKEIEELMSQPLSTDLKGQRDMTMLNVLYATGIRVTELINLKLSDINLNKGTLKVEKVKSSRIIELNNSTIRSLDNYIEEIRPLLVKPVTDDTLFLNTNGKKLTRQGFWKILKQYKEGANIKGDLTPHTIRHTFAVHQLSEGLDIKKLQEVLGHTDVAITMMYNDMLDDVNIKL